MSGAIQRAHPHDLTAEAHAVAAREADRLPSHGRRIEVFATGVMAIVAGAMVLLGGALLWLTAPVSYPLLVGPPSYSIGQWAYFVGVAFGLVVLVLGILLLWVPELHGALGAGIVIASGLTLLAGPLLWIGFILGIIAGALAVPLGTPSSPRVYYYTPYPIMPAYGPAPGIPAAPAPMVPPAAPVIPQAPAAPAGGRFCPKCGRSIQLEATFCPWCGASLGAPPT